jgi:hypothetical protein
MVNATVTCDPAGPEFTLIWSAIWQTSHSPWPGSYGHGDIRAVVLGRWLPGVLRGRPELAGPGSLTWQISSRLVALMRRRPVPPPVCNRVGGQLMHREHHVERSAFGHACIGCVREHCLAKDTQRGLTELLVQHAAAPHYPSCIR